MERKEAIEVIKNHSSFPILREALETLIPELENEDEKIRKTLIRLFTANNAEQYGEVTNKQIIDWLEKQGKPKSIWSEDDKAILKAIMQDIQERHPDAMWTIDTSKTAAVSTEFIIKFLKSLPETHWKPTKEQIEALNTVRNSHYVEDIFGEDVLYQITSLCNHLKNFEL